MEEKKIFFSYSRKDASDFALRLAGDLRSRGLTIWIDQQGIQIGQPWDQEIRNAIKSADCVLFIASGESVVSKNVLNELQYAENKEKWVIPVVIHPCELPMYVIRLQHIDFIKDYEAGLQRLLHTLGIEGPAQSKKATNGSDQEAERQFFLSAVNSGRIQSLQEYLVRYPKGENVAGAQQMIQLLESQRKVAEEPITKEESGLWNTAVEKGAISLFQEYLRKYPKGKYAEMAGQVIRILNQHRPSPLPGTSLRPRAILSPDAKTPRPFEHDPLETIYSRGLRRILKEETEEQKEERKVWNETMRQHTEAAFRAYLAKYPRGTFTYMANRNIARLHFTYYKSGVWWFLFVMLIGISIATILLGYSAYLQLWRKVMPASMNMLSIPGSLFWIIGGIWGLLYALVQINEAVDWKECLFSFFRPFQNIFSPYDFRDFIRGLMTAPFINGVLILATTDLFRYLLQLAGWNLGATVSVILFVVLHLISMLAFHQDDGW